MKDPALVLAKVASLLTEGNTTNASSLLKDHYPFEPWEPPHGKRRPEKVSGSVPNSVENPETRKYSQKESLEVFYEDGYLDRYSGSRLVCPAALYAITYALPDEFPWGRARKNSHQGLWDLFPTIDHVEPVSRGGADVRKNWVTTSMTMNMRKGNESMSQLGWSIHKAGDIAEWDGLVSWYVTYARDNPDVASVLNNKGWHKATIKAHS